MTETPTHTARDATAREFARIADHQTALNSMRKLGIEAIIAHEYFHNWTGNRITCRDWFQLCLKEGLTVFRDQEFTSDMRSRPVKRIADVRGLRGHQFVEDSGPLAHPVRPEIYHEINNFYTSTVYEKGAEVVRMIKTLLGPEQFRAGMDLYFQRHDGDAATVEQFVSCFADASGRDLSQFMLWYRQAGTPEIVATGAHDPKTKTYRLELAQSLGPTPGQPTKEPMTIPLALGLVGEDGRDLPLVRDDGAPLQHGVLVLTKPAETVTFTNIATPAVLSINRGFSAPVRLLANLSESDLGFLAAHDSDPFNRWQSLQTIATRLLVARATGGAAGDQALINALKAILSDASLEPAFVALVLTPPGESDIAREIGRDVDPDAISGARTALRKTIGAALGETLRHMRQAMSDRGPYSPDAQHAGRRALKNICLDLQAATGEAGAVAEAMTQYQAADNMTDRMAALSTLSFHNVAQRTEALDDFYRRYADNPLIVDKWLLLQAAIPESATLDRVRALTRHPAFSMANPNRVRSLIGGFAQANATQFNRVDGAGYEFVADRILELDPKNPQVASRLTTAFRSWRVLEPQRRLKAEAALRRIAAAPGLSVDVGDIARRSLAEV